MRWLTKSVSLQLLMQEELFREFFFPNALERMEMPNGMLQPVSFETRRIQDLFVLNIVSFSHLF